MTFDLTFTQWALQGLILKGLVNVHAIDTCQGGQNVSLFLTKKELKKLYE